MEGNVGTGGWIRKKVESRMDTVKLDCKGFHTIDELNKVYAWSMTSLATGQCPEARHDGEPWSDHDRRSRIGGSLRLRAGLLQVRGDWAWLCENFRFRHYANEHFCWLCEATHTGLLNYLNLAADAPWRTTGLSHET